MATTIKETNELVVTLASADGQITRTLRINNPKSTLTLAGIRTALKPATDTGYFVDESTNTQMSTVVAAQTELVRKTVTEIVDV